MFAKFRSRYDSDRAEWWFLPVAFEQGSWDVMASRGTLYGQESYGLRQGDFNPAVGVPCWECIPCSHSNSGLPEPLDLSCRMFADLLVGANRSWLQAYSSFCLYADNSQSETATAVWNIPSLNDQQSVFWYVLSCLSCLYRFYGRMC